MAEDLLSSVGVDGIAGRFPGDSKLSPEPERKGAASEEDLGYLRDQIEKMIAGIWSEVLKLDGVGAQDDFFVLGGHSLLAMRVMARIRDAAGIKIPIRVLFEASTVQKLAERVEIILRAAQLAAPDQADGASDQILEEGFI